MKPVTALKVILVIGLCGVAFSGYLSYGELTGTCASGCPVIRPSAGVFGIPSCIYGFFMYLTIVIVSLFGLRKR